MNNHERLRCRNCGCSDMRWVSALLAVWDGAVLRCASCRQLRLVPTTATA